MNVRKHMAGLALFSVITGGAIFIDAYLTAPVAVIPHAQVSAPPPQILAGKSQPVSYHVIQVTLDFTSKNSYTELDIKRTPGQPLPETLWVTTYLFSPEYPGRVWTNKSEIRHPFTASDSTEVAVTALCGLCVLSDATSHRQSANSTQPSLSYPPARTEYFARVYVSTEYADNPYPADAQFDRDIRTATPVVAHWPDNLIH